MPGNGIVENKPAELLEHCPERGIYFLQAKGELLEISSASFNPKQRFLVAGGNYYTGSLWDLRNDPSTFCDLEVKELPHISGRMSDHKSEIIADVSSVHWSNDGTRLLTSSNDAKGRIWLLNEELKTFDLQNVKPFNVMLMNSKFNKPSD